MAEIRICAIPGCGKPLRGNAKKYCGVECHRAGMLDPTRTCKHCGKLRPRGNHTYCSTECRNLGGRFQPDLTCVVCGGTYRDRTGNPEVRRYCSRACYHISRGNIGVTSAQREQIALLAYQNVRQADIARQLGLTPSAVAGIRHRMKLPRYVAPKTGARDYTTAFVHRAPEFLPKQFQGVVVERLAAGSDPLPPMHHISWGAIAL